jgi:hypothetical protein
MRTVILLGFLLLCDAVRGTTILPYTKMATVCICIILLACAYMDIIDFTKEKNVS